MQKVATSEDVLTLARRRVAEVFDRFDLPVVSFSGGKDSTVVLNLALEEMRARKADGRLPADWRLRVIFWDEECIHPPTIEYVERARALPDVDFRWLCLPIRHRNACSKAHPYWHCWAPEDEAKWVRPLPDGAITSLPGFKRKLHAECLGYVFPRAEGITVGLMLGLRADESLRRYRSVTSRVKDNWLSSVTYAPHISQCKVIYDWRTLDVWTAPHVFGWDWNRAYDQMAKVGLTPYLQRVAQPFGQQPLGTLWMWRVCWPDLWEKVCTRVPGAATAARYSLSPLYASSGAIQKHDDETWEQGIARELMKWAPKIRKQVAERIRNEIRRHNKIHPNSEIPDETPIMDLERGVTSGITYKFLFKIATKGDFKNRITPVIPGWGIVDRLRSEAWGRNWKERRPDLAAKTVWHAKSFRWMTPAEAAG